MLNIHWLHIQDLIDSKLEKSESLSSVLFIAAYLDVSYI